jgi:fibronectin type 3 domain-containing protein
VALAWAASSSTATSGYNIYRSDTSSGGFAKINPSPVAALNFMDATAMSGLTYYYALTAVDTSGDESNFSNEIQMVIP